MSLRSFRKRRNRDTSDLLTRFLGAQSSQHTRAAYRLDLRRFGEWLGLSPQKAATAAVGSDRQTLARTWLSNMKAAGLAHTTIYRRITTLRALARFAGVDLGVRAPTPKKGRSVGPSEEQLHKILAACGEGAEGDRNRVLVLVIAAGGLSPSEVRGLSARDFVEGRLEVLQRRGTKVLYLPTAVAREVERWINGADPNAPMFYGLTPPSAAPLSRQGVTHIFEQISKRLGEPVQPKQLQRFASTVAVQKGFSWARVVARSKEVS